MLYKSEAKGVGCNMLFFFSVIEDEDSRKKLATLYTKYYKVLYKVAYRILNDEYLAEDAVQSAFIKLVDCLDKIDEINCNKTRAFIVIVVRNISIDLYRKRKKQYSIALEDIEEFISDGTIPLDEKLINAEIFNNISSKIQELHTAYADIITLKYFYHYSDSEIAELLNISQENARVRLHRAKQSLIRLLLQDGELSKI